MAGEAASLFIWRMAIAFRAVAMKLLDSSMEVSGVTSFALEEPCMDFNGRACASLGCKLLA